MPRRRIEQGRPGARLGAIAAALVFVGLATGGVAAQEEGSPGDVKFERQAAGMDDVPPATFPHWIHRMAYTCYACHEVPFKMKKGENEVTMDMIQSGQSCGVCHDGKTAFESSLKTCNRCHR